MKRGLIAGLLALGFAAAPLRAQYFSYSHNRELRITTLDTITAAPHVQHARIDRSHGDTILIHDLSPGPIHAGPVPATSLVEARWTHGHAIVGALAGIAAGFVVLRILYHRPVDGVGMELVYGGLVGIPVGAVVGTFIRTTSWVPIRSSQFTLEVGAAGAGIGLTLHAADHS